MSRFENGWVSPRVTRWLHKISLLVFVGQQGKNRVLDKKRLACAQWADFWLSQCSGSSFGGASKHVFPTVYVKLDIMKQFVKALEKDGDCFKYICMKFPGLTIEKLKAGIFDEPQIRKLMDDANFCNFMNSAELSAWMAFTNAVKFFLKKIRAPNYKEIFETVLTSIHQLGTNISIKLHFCTAIVLVFQKIQVIWVKSKGNAPISDMEVRYQDRWDATILADYCWSIKRDDARASHSRKSVKRQFMADDVYA